MEQLSQFIGRLQKKGEHERRTIALAASAVFTLAIVGALMPFIGEPPPGQGDTASAANAMPSTLSDLKRDALAFWQKAMDLVATSSAVFDAATTGTANAPVANVVSNAAAPTATSTVMMLDNGTQYVPPAVPPAAATGASGD